MLIVYASMSGNSEFIAQAAAQALRDAALQPVDVQPADLAPLDTILNAGSVLFVLSTWGQGEPPADAEPLLHAINTAPADALRPLRFAIIGLGDHRYPIFCGAAHLLADALVAKSACQIADPLLLDGVPVEQYADQVRQHVQALFTPQPAPA